MFYILELNTADAGTLWFEAKLIPNQLMRSCMKRNLQLYHYAVNYIILTWQNESNVGGRWGHIAVSVNWHFCAGL